MDKAEECDSPPAESLILSGVMLGTMSRAIRYRKRSFDHDGCLNQHGRLKFSNGFLIDGTTILVHTSSD